MLGEVILAIGTRHFSRALFSAIHRALGIRQMTIYRYVPDRQIETLAAESAGEDEQLRNVIRQYVRNFHKRDPLWPDLSPSADRRLLLRSVNENGIEDPEFRNRLYRQQRMAGKISLIMQRPADVISVSFFRGNDFEFFSGAEISLVEQASEVLAAAIERNFLLQIPRHLDLVGALIEECEQLPSRPPLSQQEANVCGRILAGLTADAVASELNISFHSVVTYRRRAYSKLNVTSQAELFSHILSRRLGLDPARDPRENSRPYTRRCHS